MLFVSIVLLIDDAIAILVVTLIGLGFHQMEAVLWDRLPFTFFPFYLAWVLAAAALQLYSPARAGDWAQLWRVPIAAAIATLPAAALRSLWLATPLVPAFVLVMGLAIAVGLLVSRGLYILSFGSRWRQHG
ncbi:MAG TPA: DUF3054 family protein [Anaerolineales bacterium]